MNFECRMTKFSTSLFSVRYSVFDIKTLGLNSIARAMKRIAINQKQLPGISPKAVFEFRLRCH